MTRLAAVLMTLMLPLPSLAQPPRTTTTTTTTTTTNMRRPAPRATTTTTTTNMRRPAPRATTTTTTTTPARRPTARVTTTTTTPARRPAPRATTTTTRTVRPTPARQTVTTTRVAPAARYSDRRWVVVRQRGVTTHTQSNLANQVNDHNQMIRIDAAWRAAPSLQRQRAVDVALERWLLSEMQENNRQARNARTPNDLREIRNIATWIRQTRPAFDAGQATEQQYAMKETHLRRLLTLARRDVRR